MGIRNSHITSTTCFVLATILAASSAHAQSTAEGPAGADQTDEIVVTAEKRPTLSRDVAGGVSALNESTLKDARINRLEDAARLVPGFEFGKESQLTFPVIRGVSPQIIGDPTVSVLVDGFTFANLGAAASAEVFDASRIEVLKGPQSTLYGANSLGGIVNIISKLPSLDKIEGDFRGSYGSYDSTILRGAVSLPIVSDKLAIRVGGYLNSRDGFYDNRFNGRDGQDAEREKGARFAARFKPNDVWDSALIYTYSHFSTDCGDCSNPIIGPAATPPLGGRTLGGSDLGRYTDSNIPGYRVQKLHRVTWNNTFDLGGVNLTSLTGYGYLFNGTITDGDRGPGDTLAGGFILGGAVIAYWDVHYTPATRPFGLAGWQATFLAFGIPGLLLALLMRT